MARQLRRSGALSIPSQPARRVAVRPDFGGRGRGIGQFLGEVRAELRKVVWPTRREAVKMTSLVVAMSVAVGLLLGLIDFGFTKLFEIILR